MKLNLENFKNYHQIAKDYSFNKTEGVFTCDIKLFKDSIFGLDKNSFLIIILPLNCDLASFQIKDFLTLKENTKFFSENKKLNLEGFPLVFKRKNIDDQFGFLSQINLLLESNDYVDKLSQFFDILQKARNSKSNFNGPAFFAEACTIKKLLKSIPNIANQWSSSATSTIDIYPSEFNPAIEVKSTTSIDERIHKLSIQQVRYFQNNKSSLLASVVIYKKENGISCKEICERFLNELPSSETGYAQIKGALLAYSELTDFTDSCFDEGMTINSIQFYEPDFPELPLDTPPLWLRGGKLDVDMEALQLSKEY